MAKRKNRLEPTEEDLARGKTFAQWLRSAITARGTNPSQLSKKSSVANTYIYDLLADGIKQVDGMALYKRPSREVVISLASALEIDPSGGLKAAGYEAEDVPPSLDMLAGLPAKVQAALASAIREVATVYGGGSESDFVRLPVVGFVGAVEPGFDVFAEEHAEGWNTVLRESLRNHPAEKCFIVKVRGNCLAGDAILDGDLATCVQTDAVKDGDVVLVSDEDNVVLKRYRDRDGERWLETHERDGTRYEYQLEGTGYILGKLIHTSREY